MGIFIYSIRIVIPKISPAIFKNSIFNPVWETRVWRFKTPSHFEYSRVEFFGTVRPIGLKISVKNIEADALLLDICICSTPNIFFNI